MIQIIEIVFTYVWYQHYQQYMLVCLQLKSHNDQTTHNGRVIYFSTLEDYSIDIVAAALLPKDRAP